MLVWLFDSKRHFPKHLSKLGYCREASPAEEPIKVEYALGLAMMKQADFNQFNQDAKAAVARAERLQKMCGDMHEVGPILTCLFLPFALREIQS